MRSGATGTCAPPRTGVRRCTGRAVGEGAATGATARSTPKIGRTPCSAQAFAKRTAPATVSRSVSASAVIPRWAARSTSAPGCEAPYRAE